MSDNVAGSVTPVHTSPLAHARILVTGISGFIGGHLAQALLGLGANVVGIVRDEHPISFLKLTNLESRAHIVKGTLTDTMLVERVINEYEIDIVFHLAAQADVRLANRLPVATFESNIKGTWNLLEACKRKGEFKSIVIASSDKAYGSQKELPYTEASPLNATNPYDTSKACVELLARCYAATYELPVVLTRCGNVYGGGDLNWARLIPGTIHSILQGKRPILRSDGTAVRDFIHITDVIKGYLLLGERACEENLRGQAFNLGTGLGTSVLEIVQHLLSCSRQNNLAIDIQGKGIPNGEIDYQYLNTNKAAHLLGWSAQVDVVSGLEMTWEWYRKHHDQLVYC